MIIEFYGLPSSGKTTDMKAVLEKYENSISLTDYSKTVSRIKRLPLVFTPEFISFFFRMIMLYLKKKNRSYYIFKSFSVFCCVYLRYMYARKSKEYDYYLIDHGIIQNIVTVLWDEDTPVDYGKKLVSYAGKNFAQDIAFIYTDVGSAENAYSRIQTRGNEIRLKNFSPEKSKKILEIHSSLFEQLTEEAQKHFSVLTVDSLDSFENCFDKICNYIDKLN